MKRILSLALFTMIFANPTVAQVATPTQTGGGSSVTVHSTKGSATVKDTTAHTETTSGATVSTSTNKNDGKTPNGGVRTDGDK